jgi:hypothetical protein
MEHLKISAVCLVMLNIKINVRCTQPPVGGGTVPFQFGVTQNNVKEREVLPADRLFRSILQACSCFPRFPTCLVNCFEKRSLIGS